MKKKSSKILTVILLVVAALTASFSAYKIVSVYLTGKEEQEVFDELASLVEMDAYV